MEQHSSCLTLLKKCSEQIGIHLQVDQLKEFALYLEQLQIWNRSINLTSITSDEEIVVKHFIDSIAALAAESIKSGSSLLDIGTGAGFPGLPLKIARKDVRITLVEPVQKKVSFLYSIVGLLRLEDVNIFYGTLDQFMSKSCPIGTFDYITTRALKYDFILRNAERLLTDGGRTIIYSSYPIDQIVIENAWSTVSEFEFDLPMNMGHRVISVLSPLQRSGQP